MITLIIAAALFADQGAAGMPDAIQALQAGRLDQARIILQEAAKSGVQGDQIDRLRAELAYRSGNWAEAHSRYQQLAAIHPGETLTLERAGIAAFHVGDIDKAAAALTAATSSPAASWRAWNALGVVADYRRAWPEADTAYGHALNLAQDQPEVLNNLGWSYMLRGQWAEALANFERAKGLDASLRRIANNLELARAALAEDLPRRRVGEKDSEWAARLNDAGVLAAASGDRQRAIAAFSQAIEASSSWFERAANNLALAEQ